MDSCELWDPPGNDCCEASVAGGRGWEDRGGGGRESREGGGEVRETRGAIADDGGRRGRGSRARGEGRLFLGTKEWR